MTPSEREHERARKSIALSANKRGNKFSIISNPLAVIKAEGGIGESLKKFKNNQDENTLIFRYK